MTMVRQQYNPTLPANVGVNLDGVLIDPTLVEAASGTHALFTGFHVAALSITGAGASTTVAASMYVAGPPTIGSTNYALFVDDGAVQFDGNLDVTGTLTVTGTATITQTDSTAEATLAADTRTAMTDPVATTAGWGASSEANFDLIITEINEVIADLRDLKSCFNSLVDGLQAQGLVG